MPSYFQNKSFEEQLNFHFPGTSYSDNLVMIGSTSFTTREIFEAFPAARVQEFGTWLNDVWVPTQHTSREAIFTVTANRQRYNALREAYGKNYLIPFVGSGMSVPSGLPTWSEFLEEISQFTNRNLDEIRLLLMSYSFEDCFRRLADSMNPYLLEERIEHLLNVESSDIAGPVLMLPDLFPKTAMTTNLDMVLEFAYELARKSFDITLMDEELYNYYDYEQMEYSFLLKLHGDHRVSTSQVLHPYSYDKAYAASAPAVDVIETIYRHHSLLFLGCSLDSDRTMQLLENIVNSNPDLPRHYAFLPACQTDYERNEREEYLSARKIFPIWYEGDHDESIIALLDGLVDY